MKPSLRILYGGVLALALPAAVAAAGFDHGHAAYGRVLSRFVKDARVDYAGLKAAPAELEAYLSALAAAPEAEFRKWSREERLAFLLNLYNARTLELIADHYPVESIKNIGNFLKGPWDQPVVPLFGKTITLGDLEHKIIRREYGDPRVHFAMVCAAKGCPPLRGEPYAAGRLDAQLDDQGRAFMADATKNRIDAAGKVLYLSPIFDWFEEDFVKKAGSVQAFVAPYLGKPAAEGYKVEFTHYDWTLNGIER